jgi:DNA ligase D-like protein (predicted ligase)
MSRIVKRSASGAIKPGSSRRGVPLPLFVPPQLSKPVEKPPSGPQWLHEIKLDGYRMAARIDNGHAQLLTRTGLDWTAKYPSAAAALANLNVKTAYLDGELCGVDDAGLPSFAQTQAATDGEREVRLVYYAFDLLHLSGWNISGLPPIERKALLEPVVTNKPGIQFNGHDTGDGELILKHAGKLGFEGVVSKTIDAPYAPGNRGLWRKAKALNRQEFVIVGWSDPEGSRPHLGALLLGYYTDDGKLIYAGRVGAGMPVKVLADLRRRLEPLARKTSPLSVQPPRKTRFGSPLVLSRVHWIEPELVAEITYLTWTADGLLQHTVYVGLREDKAAEQVRRDVSRELRRTEKMKGGRRTTRRAASHRQIRISLLGSKPNQLDLFRLRAAFLHEGYSLRVPQLCARRKRRAKPALGVEKHKQRTIADVPLPLKVRIQRKGRLRISAHASASRSRRADSHVTSR